MSAHSMDVYEALRRGPLPKPRHAEHNMSLVEPDERSKTASEHETDVQALRRQGKRAQMQRRFGFTSMLGFTTTMLITWEGGLMTNKYALTAAGPVGLYYGFLYATLGCLATAASLSEMVSIAPTSGGQYHWTYLLASPRHRNFLSWITGWLSVMGWQISVASAFFLAANITQALVSFNHAAYEPQDWQLTLILWAFLAVGVFFNTMTARILPSIEGIVLIVHILGFFAILIPMVYLSDKQPPSFVFATYRSDSGWSSPGLNFFIGLLSGMYPYVGYDGACHMAEEVRDSARNVPRSLTGAIALNAVLAIAMMTAFLFCVENYGDALSDRYQYPFIAVFYSATLSKPGTTAMASLLIYMLAISSIGLFACSSRMTWAFARDRGMPCSRWLATIDARFAIPLNSIWACTGVVFVFSLLIIGSSVAFNIIASVMISCLHISYGIPIYLMLRRRLAPGGVRHGPWWLGRRTGAAVNVFSLVYLLLMTTFSFFPPDWPVSASNMNYSCVVFLGILGGGVVYYHVHARKVYQGPVIDVVVGLLPGGGVMSTWSKGHARRGGGEQD